jgi:hypothetical protein
VFRSIRLLEDWAHVGETSQGFPGSHQSRLGDRSLRLSGPARPPQETGFNGLVQHSAGLTLSPRHSARRPHPPSSVFPRSSSPANWWSRLSYRRAMESSLRNILHSNEPSYESSTLHTGHLSAAVEQNGAFIGTLEAENALNESRKRPATRIKVSTPQNGVPA